MLNTISILFSVQKAYVECAGQSRGWLDRSPWYDVAFVSHVRRRLLYGTHEFVCWNATLENKLLCLIDNAWDVSIIFFLKEYVK